MTDEADIPRWARPLGEETWQRINELIDAGWATMDIVRELSIPEKKIRSLQLFVQRNGPRRRLTRFAAFKDALLTQIEEFGADLVESLGVIAQLATSPATKPATQVRALEAMTNFTNVLTRMMGEDAKAEEKRQLEESGTQKIDVNTLVARVLERYGVDGVDGGGGDD